jgi:superfamily II DNA or RNA helicase
MSERQKNLGFHLNNYQAEFVDRFLNSNTMPNHILSAPVGSGKTATALAIIYEMVKMGARRILILVPALALVDQYKRSLSMIEQDINVVSLDRKIIREIDFLNQKETFWAKSIAILPLRQAASDEIKESILSIHWDLIIVDESEHFITNSKNAMFLQMIAERRIAERVLLLTNQAPSIAFQEGSDMLQLNKLRDRFETTRWRRKDIFPSNRTREIKYNLVSYKRTEEEVEFIKKYTSLSKWLSSRAAQNKIRSRLVSSSLYAAEESLRNLRNRLMHGDLRNILDIDEADGSEFIQNEELLGDTNRSQVDRKFGSTDLPVLMNDLSVALEHLDRIQIDSKFNLLSQVVNNIRHKQQRTWIYTSYQSTISFLHSSLSEQVENVFQIHSQIPPRITSESIQRFKENGGFLISSTSQLMGIDLALDNLILYDMPESENLIYTIFTRISGSSQEKHRDPVNMIVFDDTSNAIKSERNRLEKMQRFLQQIIQEEM